MQASDIRNVVVVGSGMMGNQITEAFSRAGLAVNMVDVNQELVNRGIASINNRLEKFFVAKGQMSPDDKQQVMQRIGGSVDLTGNMKKADLMIEAVVENMNVKREIFAKADKAARPETILATNTSYLNITDISMATGRPDKVAGMHFFNPVARIKLIERPSAALTSAETIQAIAGMAVKLGKEPVVCSGSSYGFLANRVYMPMRMEAVQMVWERAGTPADIDKAVRLGYNLPLGPLELSDMSGSWALYASSEQDKIRELGSEKGHLHPLIREMVRAGYTGGSGKKGIYDFWKDVLAKK